MGLITILYALLWIGGILVCAGLLVYYIIQRSREKKEEAKKDYTKY